MFNKELFSQILNKIYKTYNNQRDFANAAEVNRSYLSQYINQKLDNPPTPKILVKIANASHGITTYEELMKICGHIKNNDPESYLIGMLGLTENDILNFDTKLKKINLSENENSIFINIVKKIQDKATTKDSSYKLNILDYIKNENIVSQKKIINALNLYMEYLKKMSEFASIASKKNNININIIDIKNDNLNTDIKNEHQYYMCPVYGRIAAGQPNWAEECIEGRIPIDPELMGIVNPEEHFFLRVNGESMNNVIKNGAFALIHKQDTVKNGEIAVVLVNGDTATLKRFTKKDDIVVLEPDSSDPEFKTQIYDKTTPIRILGKYVGKMEINN